MHRPGRLHPGSGLTVAVMLAVAAIVAGGCAGEPAGPRADASPAAAPSSTEAGTGQRTVVVETGGQYTSIDPGRLAAVLASEDVTLINVHVPYAGEIENTDTFIPYDRIAERRDELPPEPDAPIVVYCRSGRMSTVAATILVGLGYTDIRELDGGFEAWQAAGYPLLQRPGG